MEWSRWRRWGWMGVIGLVACTSSCSCEERIREMISNPGDRGSAEFNSNDAGDESTSPEGPRESEPNNRRREANAIELGSNLDAFHGSIEGRDDVDWYQLQVPDESSWRLELTITPLSGSFDPVLGLAVDGASDVDDLQTYDVGGAGEQERIPVLEVDASTTTLAVRSRDGTEGRYRLDFQKRLSRGAVEAEPNDTRDTAIPFPYPGEIQGFYDRPGDRDLYHVSGDTLKSGIHSLQVTPTGEFPQTVALETGGDAGEPYLRFEVPPEKRHVVPNVQMHSDLEQLWFTLSAGESYDLESGYRLRLIEHPPLEENELVLEGEPNGDHDSAQRIELGTELRGYLHRPSDRDHFELTVGDVEEDGESETTADAGDTSAESTSEARDAGSPLPPRQLDPESTSDAGEPSSGSPSDAGRPDTGAPRDWRARLPDKAQPRHRVRVALKPLRDSDRLTLLWFQEDRSSPRRMTSPQEGEAVRICSHPIDRGLMEFAVKGAELEERRIRRGFTYALAFQDISEATSSLELEPNDRREQADRLEMGGERQGHVSSSEDRDIYAFVVSRPDAATAGASTPDASPPSSNDDAGSGESGSLLDESAFGTAPREDDDPTADETSNKPPEPTSVRIELEGTQLNLQFDILDEAGAPVAEVDRRGAGAGESMQLALPPGLYYVRVSSAREFSCEPYTLRLRAP